MTRKIEHLRLQDSILGFDSYAKRRGRVDLNRLERIFEAPRNLGAKSRKRGEVKRKKRNDTAPVGRQAALH